MFLKPKNTFLLVALLFSLGCSPTLSPFNDRLQKEYNWAEGDLKKIQFYLSDDIILSQEISKGNSRIEGGEVIVRDGREVQQIIIQRGTPGVLVDVPKENLFAVCFDAKNIENYLVFGPHPKQGGKYVLLAKNWENNSPEVTYGGQTFSLRGTYPYTALLINMNNLSSVRVKTKVEQGRKVE